MRIALAGNPNSGKTTLFNNLTGANQRVGNWPGVTVEHKVGCLKYNKDIEIIDLPGIYSLSPYTSEEEIARNYLLTEQADAIINIVDGTNLERNLYLTTQLSDLNIPIVLAVNMSDVIKKTGDVLDNLQLNNDLDMPIVSISALTGENIKKLTDVTLETIAQKKILDHKQKSIKFCPQIETVLDQISKIALNNVDPNLERWYKIKLFERDDAMQKQLNINDQQIDQIDQLITTIEDRFDDDSESIITTERYDFISNIIKNCYQKKNAHKLSFSDKIDRIVTNRILALPVFIVVMFLVYFISVSTVGSWTTDWTNEKLFGDGWFFLGKGSKTYDEEVEEYETSQTLIEAFELEAMKENIPAKKAQDLTASAHFYDKYGQLVHSQVVDYLSYNQALTIKEPDPNNYGPWMPGIPVLIEHGLEKLNVSNWLHDLIINGIVAGVGAVLGFAPQMFVLFLCLAFLESVGYMARIAFIMDRIFRRFGLSGKSFIPLMIGTGCSVPGIMAARTIENEKDRRMTIITTSFIPCSAKLPIIALIAGGFFGGQWWVAASAYFIGIFAVIVSGIILKKTKMFAGEVAPFIIELPAYHLPRLRDILRSALERAWAFIKTAGSIILLTTIVVWFLTAYGFENGFGRVMDAENSLLAGIGSAVGWVFIPLGFPGWRPAVATITGLIAKENIVSTFGILYSFEAVSEIGWQIWTSLRADFIGLSAYSFLLFNLLCAPCFAAIGAIKREMNSAKWTAFAILYQTVFAYTISLIFYQFGLLAQGNTNAFGLIIASILFIAYFYLLFRPKPKYDLQEQN